MRTTEKRASAAARILFAGMLLWASGCGLFRRGAPPGDSGLLFNGGLESEEGWMLSAPPGYGEYAVIEFTDHGRKSGRRCAHVALLRHPPGAGSSLYGWTQVIDPPPRRPLRLSGWVKVRGETKPYFGVEFTVQRPRNGRTLFRFEVPPVPADGRYHFVTRDIPLPEDVTRLVVYLGIGSLGEAWFDELSLQFAK